MGDTVDLGQIVAPVGFDLRPARKQVGEFDGIVNDLGRKLGGFESLKVGVPAGLTTLGEKLVLIRTEAAGARTEITGLGDALRPLSSLTRDVAVGMGAIADRVKSTGMASAEASRGLGKVAENLQAISKVAGNAGVELEAFAVSEQRSADAAVEAGAGFAIVRDNLKGVTQQANNAARALDRVSASGKTSAERAAAGDVVSSGAGITTRRVPRSPSNYEKMLGAARFAGNASLFVTGVTGAVAYQGGKFEYGTQVTANNARMSTRELAGARAYSLKESSKYGLDAADEFNAYKQIRDFGYSDSAARAMLDPSSALARGTDSPVADTAKAEASIMKAFNFAPTTANINRVTASAFAASKAGNMSFTQFEESFKRFAAVDANRSLAGPGNNYDIYTQAAALFSTLTEHGFNPAVSGTQLRGLAASVTNPVPQVQKIIARFREKSGLDLSKFYGTASLNKYGLGGDIEGVESYLEEAGLSAVDRAQMLSKLYPNMRGGEAALNLAGIARGDYASILKYTRQGASPYDAASSVNNTSLGAAEKDWTDLQNKFKGPEAIKIADNLVPDINKLFGLLDKIADGALSLAKKFSGLPDPVRLGVEVAGTVRLFQMLIGGLSLGASVAEAGPLRIAAFSKLAGKAGESTALGKMFTFLGGAGRGASPANPLFVVPVGGGVGGGAGAALGGAAMTEGEETAAAGGIVGPMVRMVGKLFWPALAAFLAGEALNHFVIDPAFAKDIAENDAVRSNALERKSNLISQWNSKGAQDHVNFDRRQLSSDINSPLLKEYSFNVQAATDALKALKEQTATQYGAAHGISGTSYQNQNAAYANALAQAKKNLDEAKDALDPFTKAIHNLRLELQQFKAQGIVPHALAPLPKTNPSYKPYTGPSISHTPSFLDKLPAMSPHTMYAEASSRALAKFRQHQIGLSPSSLSYIIGGDAKKPKVDHKAEAARRTADRVNLGDDRAQTLAPMSPADQQMMRAVYRYQDDIAKPGVNQASALAAMQDQVRAAQAKKDDAVLKVDQTHLDHIVALNERAAGLVREMGSNILRDQGHDAEAQRSDALAQADYVRSQRSDQIDQWRVDRGLSVDQAKKLPEYNQMVSQADAEKAANVQRANDDYAKSVAANRKALDEFTATLAREKAAFDRKGDATPSDVFKDAVDENKRQAQEATDNLNENAVAWFGGKSLADAQQTPGYIQAAAQIQATQTAANRSAQYQSDVSASSDAQSGFAAKLDEIRTLRDETQAYGESAMTAAGIAPETLGKYISDLQGLMAEVKAEKPVTPEQLKEQQQALLQIIGQIKEANAQMAESVSRLQQFATGATGKLAGDFGSATTDALDAIEQKHHKGKSGLAGFWDEFKGNVRNSVRRQGNEFLGQQVEKGANAVFGKALGQIFGSPKGNKPDGTSSNPLHVVPQGAGPGTSTLDPLAQKVLGAKNAALGSTGPDGNPLDPGMSAGGSSNPLQSILGNLKNNPLMKGNNALDAGGIAAAGFGLANIFQKKKKHSWLAALGGIAGGIGGFMLGGPVGAEYGFGAGSYLGGQFANGGQMDLHKYNLVGEKGPEIVGPGGFVIPMHGGHSGRSGVGARSFAGSGSGQHMQMGETNVHINGNVYGVDDLEQRVHKAVKIAQGSRSGAWATRGDLSFATAGA